jgi:DNA-binding transcriptional MerR regulator
MAADKAAGALRTIGELAQEIGRPQHILRYWETRFPQLRPLTRAGNRRYYRPEDVTLVHRIHHLLADEGYTIRGVQRLLQSERSGKPIPAAPPAPGGAKTQALRAVRDALVKALDDDSGR